MMATTPGQSGPGSNGNEEVFRTPLNSSITRDSPSGYQDTRWEQRSYSSAEMQSVYSTAPADWALYIYI